MTFTAAQIALLVNGIVEGNAETVVSAFGKIEEAKSGELSFLANPKYEDFLYTTDASIILVNESLVLKHPVDATLIRVPDAYSAFAQLLNKYQELMSSMVSGIQEPSYIAKTATLGNNVYVGAFAYIGENVVLKDDVKIYPGTYIGNNVVVEEKSILFPGVKVYHDCKIGKHVTVHAGTVIGSDGFGFAPQADGTFKKIPQIGNVVIEDFVEVGANAAIDRATIGSTIIRKGAKLDNLIQVAHNVEVGQNSVLAAQSGISGSTKLGKNVMVGGQAGIVGHLQIADGSKINAQSGVSKSIKQPNTAVTGTPAYDYTSALRSQAVSRNLPDLEKRVKELETLVQALIAERVTF
jgi:UDP-3-O-[3-hydroxymyristoyl] glucosamine N-acyltransferase